MLTSRPILAHNIRPHIAHVRDGRINANHTPRVRPSVRAVRCGCWVQGEARRCKLCDFGIASKMGPDGAVLTPGPVSAIGSVPYMAPEVLEERECGAPSDVYAYGVMRGPGLAAEFETVREN